jgi:hypothetical protein
MKIEAIAPKTSFVKIFILSPNAPTKTLIYDRERPCLSARANSIALFDLPSVYGSSLLRFTDDLPPPARGRTR